jgi:hypothetical protein
MKATLQKQRLVRYCDIRKVHIFQQILMNIKVKSNKNTSQFHLYKLQQLFIFHNIHFVQENHQRWNSNL